MRLQTIAAILFADEIGEALFQSFAVALAGFPELVKGQTESGFFCSLGLG